ncbi:MAG: tRNA dihydrouridine synthase DusB [Oscillospiraceae bacterium]
MVKIGTVSIPGQLSLAPMAGVTDTAFRKVCKACGAALTYTEMVSAKALSYKDKKSHALLLLGENEHPAAAQIFGSDPLVMEEAAGIAREISGADIIDINMGCPVGKVSGNGEGCALMRDPDKAMKIIEAVVRGCGVPVTVKFRKGWDKGSINAVEFGKMCEAAGAGAIAVHGRTKTQMYTGVADWDIIRDVKQAVSIPVFANGDVFEPEDAPHILEYTGCDMAMIGRGSFGNPWIFSRANALLAGEALPPPPTLSERVDTAVHQFELAAQYKCEKIACLEARRHFAWYLRGVPYSGYFKPQIVKLETMDDIYRLAKQIKKELR